MFKPINGFTKAKILAVLAARPLGGRAYNSALQVCEYLSADGNRCAVGLFIPDGHDGLKYRALVEELLIKFPDLATTMPLELAAMEQLQKVHDSCTDAKFQMIAWVNRNVSDDAA